MPSVEDTVDNTPERPVKYTAVVDEEQMKADLAKVAQAIKEFKPSAFKTPADESWGGWDSLRQLQQFCRDNSVAKGFGKEGDDMRDLAEELRRDGNDTLADQVLANYFSKRMNLIHDELAEAHEELRNGKRPNEEYKNEKPGKEGKPEGIPSELADIMIRTLDLAGEYEIDLADVIFGKTAYNASREAMHGRKF